MKKEFLKKKNHRNFKHIAIALLENLIWEIKSSTAKEWELVILLLKAGATISSKQLNQLIYGKCPWMEQMLPFLPDDIWTSDMLFNIVISFIFKAHDANATNISLEIFQHIKTIGLAKHLFTEKLLFAALRKNNTPVIELFFECGVDPSGINGTKGSKDLNEYTQRMVLQYTYLKSLKQINPDTTPAHILPRMKQNQLYFCKYNFLLDEELEKVLPFLKDCMKAGILRELMHVSYGEDDMLSKTVKELTATGESEIAYAIQFMIKNGTPFLSVTTKMLHDFVRLLEMPDYEKVASSVLCEIIQHISATVFDNFYRSNTLLMNILSLRNFSRYSNKVCRLLIRKGALPTNSTLVLTPLHIAAYRNRTDAIRCMFQHHPCLPTIIFKNHQHNWMTKETRELVQFKGLSIAIQTLKKSVEKKLPRKDLGPLSLLSTTVLAQINTYLGVGTW